jgi:hypothetical protein
MDISSLLLGAAMFALPLIGAGLLGAIMLLGRPKPLSPLDASGAPNGTPRRRQGRDAARRRR